MPNAEGKKPVRFTDVGARGTVGGWGGWGGGEGGGDGRFMFDQNQTVLVFSV